MNRTPAVSTARASAMALWTLSLLAACAAEGTGTVQASADFSSAGDFAYGLSRFNIQVEPSRCLLDAGHLLTVWRGQDGGEWRIESLVVNQLREPPENACGLRQR